MPPTDGLRVDHYKLLAELVERGLELGWNRAHKHTATPDKDLIVEKMYDAVMGEIGEFYRFGED